jgi:hypothetical protein
MNKPMETRLMGTQLGSASSTVSAERTTRASLVMQNPTLQNTLSAPLDFSSLQEREGGIATKLVANPRKVRR